MSPEGTAASFREIRALADEYRGIIDVYAGVELDGESGIPTLDYDFIIASVHEMVRRGANSSSGGVLLRTYSPTGASGHSSSRGG